MMSSSRWRFEAAASLRLRSTTVRSSGGIAPSSSFSSSESSAHSASARARSPSPATHSAGSSFSTARMFQE